MNGGGGGGGAPVRVGVVDGWPVADVVDPLSRAP